MLDLAVHSDEGPVALEVLAQDERIPERYLAKIIQDLRRSGLIRSVRGAGGGYMLNRPPGEISILDVWEALEGPLCPVECLDDESACDMETSCVTREVWDELREAMVGVLGARTLAELAKRDDVRAAR
jgi:Rrf2 family protein